MSFDYQVDSNEIVMNVISPSKREIEVLGLIANEFTTKEIAQTLYISPDTVQTHRRNLLVKFDARNTAGLIRRAFEHRILSIN